MIEAGLGGCMQAIKSVTDHLMPSWPLAAQLVLLWLTTAAPTHPPASFMARTISADTAVCCAAWLLERPGRPVVESSEAASSTNALTCEREWGQRSGGSR